MAEFVFLEDRESAVRVSALPYPESIWKRAKYRFWRAIYPIYPYIRDGLLDLRIIRHRGRQRYVLGRIKPSRELKDFLLYLERQGFGNHFIAWEDDDEVISLRRPDGFERQYHLRIFRDGEVRGHYELTPECHPIHHLQKYVFEPRRKEFLIFCGDWITPA